MPIQEWEIKKETKVYLNFDGTHKFVNRQDIHTNEIVLILLGGLLSGIRTNRAYINRNRLINRESAVVLFTNYDATISTNGFTQTQCINHISSLIKAIQNKGDSPED